MSADGFTDWNKFTLDQHCEILENEFRFSSSGIAKSVFELIEFYKKHKPSEGNTQPDTESKLNIADVINPVCPLCKGKGEYSFGGSFGGTVQTVRCPCGANGL